MRENSFEMMMEEIINCLDAGCYLSALSNTMILIDACARIEFPSESSNKIRYKNWFKTYIQPNDKFVKEFDGTPYINDNIAYSLRCNLLHEANIKVGGDTPIPLEDEIDVFELKIEKTKEFDVYISEYGLVGTKRCISLNVQQFCRYIYYIIKKYYETHKEQFNNYCIIRDIDKEMEFLNKYMH